MSPPSEFLSIPEAAKHCQVSRRTVTSWLQKKLITKYVAPNGYNVRIKRTELESFDEARRGDNPTVPVGSEPAERYLG